MADQKEFKSSIVFARNLAKAFVRAMLSDERKAETRIGALKQKAADASARLQKTEKRPWWAAGKAGESVWRFGKGKLWNKGIVSARLESEEAARLLAEERASWSRRRLTRNRLTDLVRELGTVSKSIDSFALLPEQLAEAARGPIGTMRDMRRNRKRNVAHLEKVGWSLIETAKAWSEAERERQEKERSRTKVTRGAPRPTTHATGPIYLPVPYAMSYDVRQAGAFYDPNAKGSRFYVPEGAPLAGFERFLPLAYRQQAPVLSFPPVRNTASGQNLWSVFDATTWKHIRTINYDRTGKRCILCGKQSGKLLSVIDGNLDREGTVDCHEIWEWSVPDPSTSVGIQKLTGIIVVCAECHMTFHDSFAKSRARELGIEQEVMKFLMKRRHFLTRTHPVDIAVQMNEERATLKKHSSVKHWIIDLDHLGRQDYMRHVKPVFRQENPASVTPDQIAGLAFVTDRGEEWTNSPAEELHARASDLFRKVSVIDFDGARRR